jgi:hypothetical protein
MSRKRLSERAVLVNPLKELEAAEPLQAKCHGASSPIPGIEGTRHRSAQQTECFRPHPGVRAATHHRLSRPIGT